MDSTNATDTMQFFFNKFYFDQVNKTSLRQITFVAKTPLSLTIIVELTNSFNNSANFSMIVNF